MDNIKIGDASSLRIGSYMMIDGGACRVISIDTSRPGKHGHAKHRIGAINLITGQKKIILKAGHSRIDIPIIEKNPAQVLSASDDKAQIMDISSYETFDAEIDDEIKGQVKEGQEVIYWDILGKRFVKQIKG